jgi:hypothetical protein
MSIDDRLDAQQQSKHLRAAMQWLNEQPHPHTVQQIEQAAQRFNLSPLSEEILLKYFHELVTQIR